MILAFKLDIDDAIFKAVENYHDVEARYLVKVAEIVRNEIFFLIYSFDGHFHIGCEEKNSS